MVSCKLRVFYWLVIHQAIPTEVGLPKSGLSDDSCMACQKVENVKHIFWESPFARTCWEKVQSLLETMLQGHLHWRVALLGDATYMIRDSLASIWFESCCFICSMETLL